MQAHATLDALVETPGPQPTGLVPAAYTEPAVPLHRATALYDYEPNGAGEIAIHEGEHMSVYLKEDDWILVKLDREGAVNEPTIGYVPANYVEEGEGTGEVGTSRSQYALYVMSNNSPKRPQPPMKGRP